MVIRIAAAAIIRKDGATLLVRKRGTFAFMQPGGKIDGDERPLATLQRELFEELGLNIRLEDVDYLGHFSAPAANEPDCLVEAEMFCLRIDRELKAQAEIEEVRWVLPGTQSQFSLAPLTRDMVLPAIWG